MERKFFTDIFSETESNVITFGVPIGRKSRQSLSSIRNVSWFIEPFDIDKKKNLMENVKIFDKGDIEIKNYGEMEKVSEAVRDIAGKNKIPFAIGGGHLLSYYTAKEMPKDAKIIVFDCHADMKDDYMDEKMVDLDFISDGAELSPKMNDSVWCRRLSEKINPENIFLIGLRTFDEDDLKYMEEKKIHFVTASDLKKNINEVRTALWKFTENSNVHISLDMDVFDPSIAPAVDHPEPGGLTFREFQNLLQDVNGKIVGIDLCCLKPIPENEVTEFLAVRSVLEIMGLVK